MFFAELNHLEIWATDIGNAYLKVFTSEKVYIIAGPDLGSVRDLSLSSAKHFTVYKVAVQDGMIDLLTVSEK
jgi:hypothetical protein